MTIFQFAEGLTDRQAAEAVRGRIDWKYALALPLDDAGFDHTVLCEFRARLIAGEAELRLFETVLTCLKEHGFVKARGRQRTDSTHVLAAIHVLNRLECVGETMRHALNTLAVVAPVWLAACADTAWVERYADREMDDHLPASRPARLTRAAVVGRDGDALLGALWAAEAPGWLREVPAVETLRRVWLQNYQVVDGAVTWRDDDDIPPAARFIGSPYDAETRSSRKRATSWLGYKVHVTETCDPGLPHLITDVQTTAAPAVDDDSLPSIQRALASRDVRPSVQLADSGDTAAELLVDSQHDHGVSLVGAAQPDVTWQAQAGMGFAAADFHIDWEARHAICPLGHSSSSWTPASDGRKQDLIKVKFAKGDGVPCPCRPHCTRAKDGRRTLTLRPPEQARALEQARARAKTPAFAATYAQREGIEGTLSFGIRVCGLRRARYIGLARTRLQHLLTATAINFLRLGRWLAGTPPARTRRTAFVRLMREIAVA